MVEYKKIFSNYGRFWKRRDANRALNLIMTDPLTLIGTAPRSQFDRPRGFFFRRK